MSVKVIGNYEGNLRVNLTHGPSKAEIRTVAPIDNNGDGTLFSPTDLVGAALGSCAMTVIAIVAEKSGLDVTGMSMEVEKEMIADPDRRINFLQVKINLPAHLKTNERQKLERAGLACPVKNSLKEGIASISYNYF
jgi:putative redox protein